MQALEIDPEFQDLIPPLKEDEFARLEANILAEGCRDPLVVWAGENVIVDGHNRYTICCNHGVEFTVKAIEFDSRDHAMLWMVRNQQGRRNLTSYVKGMLALEEQRLSNCIFSIEKETNGELNTWADAATNNETSTATMSRVKRVEAAAPEAIKKKARAGEISPTRALQLTQQIEKLPDTVQDTAAERVADNPEKARILSDLQKSSDQEHSNGTFDEIIQTGGMHYGNDMEKWCDFEAASVEEIVKAKKSIEQHHRREAGLSTLLTSEFNEWYTPQQYIEGVHLVMGGVDVDPASNDIANRIVRATTYYTIDTNGLDHAWQGRVFLNPPYGRDAGESNQEIWSKQLVSQYEAGVATEAIMLINAVTDRRWFQPLWDYTICFTDHRIRFYDDQGEFGNPTHGNAFIYFGHQGERFADIFSKFGVVVNRLR